MANLLHGIIKLIGVKRAEKIMVFLIKRYYKKNPILPFEVKPEDTGRDM